MTSIVKHWKETNNITPKKMNQEIEIYKKEGFTGFLPVSVLRGNLSTVPASNGVYIVVRENTTAPVFLREGTGGYFKGKNPNVDITQLQKKYVSDSKVLYIGKATDLHKRINQLLRFGAGVNVGHWGGRYLWQLSDSDELLIAWRETPDRDSSLVEISMLEDFRARHGKLPFANLKVG